MELDLDAAADFMATHARILDRHRFHLLRGGADPTPALAAVDAYRNSDGGYGWGLEPDLRSPESQPGAALHAFEVFEDIAPATAPQAAALCDWLESVSLPDGGLPFALPVTSSAGNAPWWADSDPSASSLQMTACVTAVALRVAAHDPAVAAHPWLERATRYCLGAIEAIGETPHAMVLAFAMRFLDAVHATRPETAALAGRLGRFIPADGMMPVAGGTADEKMRPLDFSVFPDGPVRAVFAPDVIDAELDRLAGMQQNDGGWVVDYAKISPAGALDWRGHATVHAITVLRLNGRL
ncbi:hypothetical protein [Nonomuraea cavernae]|uniref:hypothetical protein n=1 Tax=Nonomuraea cavernae TaxID=2045107 RepID=UPI0033E9ABCE